jgi:hypothetical protein
MEYLYLALSAIAGAILTVNLYGSKIMAILQFVEEKTNEGTEIDDQLDRAIKWLALVLRYATTQNSAAVKSLAESIKSKKAG